jgi:1-acyl-sn-glycerol-3-phosphate acyltransferase
MLVATLKLLMKITTRVFFKKISTRNRKVIPEKGPLMILANHPSAFLDPIVIATLINREVYFLAKGELFKSKFAQRILPKLRMIPVYRKQDDPSLMTKNKDTFEKCFQHLERGGAILMFPEGISITERKLKPIKTGAARIVLGAEARNNFKLQTKIICVGLNYEDPHRFNKEVYINFDNPLQASDYKIEFEKDEFAGVEKLTEDIRIHLEKLMINIQDESADALAKDVERLYKSKLQKELGIEKRDKDAEFMLVKSIGNSVDYFKEHSPEYVMRMQKKIKEYFRSIERLGLNDNLLNINRNKHLLGRILRAAFITIFYFPLYLYGLFNNFLPFEIPGMIAEKVITQKEFRGPVAMVCGTFTFLIFYTLQISFIQHLFHDYWFTLLYAFTLPTSGVFSYWYYHKVQYYFSKWYMIRIFYLKSSLIASLIQQRDELIKEFEKSREEYLKTNPSHF